MAMNMGAVIREYRSNPWHGSHPLPQTRVASWGGVTQGQLSRLENGRCKLMDLDRLASWARALKVPEHLLWFHLPARAASTSNNPKPVRVLSPALLVERIEPQLAIHARSILREYAATDNLTGPRPLLTLVPAHLAHLESLLPNTSGSVRADILRAAAQTAEFSGWVFQDAGDLQSAARYTDRALRYSHELADRRLMSYFLMRQSNIASDDGHAAQTLNFALAALQPWDELTPGLRAVALRQLAAGHALQDNLTAAASAIDRGLEQVACVTDNTDTGAEDLTAYCTPSYLEMEAATCWVRLGRPDSAVESLERGLSVWQPEFRRDLGLCLARAAVAYAAVDDPEQAHSAAANALVIAAETKSARTIRELRRAQRALISRGPADVAVDLAEGLRSLPL